MTVTVAAGASADFTIPTGLTGAFSTTGEALVRIKAGASGAGFETRRVTSAKDVAMGPFGNDVVVTVMGISGSTTAGTRDSFPVFQDPATGALVGAGGIFDRSRTTIACALQGDSHVAESGPFYSSNSVGMPEVGFFNWLCALSDQAFEQAVNFGISGQTTGQILERNAANIETTPTRVTDVFVACGANDVSASTPFAITIGNMAEIYRQWSAAGRTVHVLTVLPRYGQTAVIGGALARIRAWQVQHAAQHGYVLHDAWAALIDPLSATGAARQYQLRSDNLHTSVKGARAIAAEIQQRLAHRIAAARPYHVAGVIEQSSNDANSTNRTISPMVSGAVVAGVAAGYQVMATSGAPTIAASVAPRSDGYGNDQIATVTGAAAGNEVLIRTNDLIRNNLSPARRYAFECAASVSGASGLRAVRFRVTLKVDGGATQVYECLSSSALSVDEYDQSAWAGFLRVLVDIPAGSAVTECNCWLLANWAGAGAATFAMGRVSALPSS